MIEVPSVGNVILEEVEKIEGEARANNRKGKLIFFYEWEIAVKWKGHANGKDTEVHYRLKSASVMPSLPTNICTMSNRYLSDLSNSFISGDGED